MFVALLYVLSHVSWMSRVCCGWFKLCIAGNEDTATAPVVQPISWHQVLREKDVLGHWGQSDRHLPVSVTRHRVMSDE